MRQSSWFVVVTAALLWTGCGSGHSVPQSGDAGTMPDGSTNSKFTVGGSVTGLLGSGLVLRDNGADDLAVSANGSFSFHTKVSGGTAIHVTVATAPTAPSQICTVTMPTSVATHDITDIVVSCVTTTFTVGGTASGVAGSGLVLQVNGGDDLPIAADGTFTFATPLLSGATFTVTITSQPSSPTQTCSVAGGSGTVGGGNVTSVAVSCATGSFTVGGAVSGLVGTGLVLSNNGGDDLSISANGTFAFATPIISGGAFAVTVKTSPTGPAQTCSVASGSGTVVADAVSSVVVTCSTDSHTVGGTVSGLSGTGLVLQNNQGNDLPIGADGSFSFTAPVASGGTYLVAVSAQPASPSQTCTVAGASGTIATADVSDVVVTCVTNTFTVGGTAVGIVGHGLALTNNGGDTLAISADGTFTFATPIVSGNPFQVAIATQPTSPSQNCSISGAQGTVGGSAVTSVTVNCMTSRFVIGGAVSGLAGSGLQLALNGGTALPVGGNGTFAFPTTVASGSAYTVTVATQPTSPWQTCSVASGTGAVTASDVSNVQVTCVTDTHTVGGTVAGLTGGGLVLENNAGNDLPVTASGAFTFSALVTSGQGYAVTVKTQPTSPSQTCSVTAGSGAVGGADIANVTVQCVTNTYSVRGTISGLAGTVVLLDNSDPLTLNANGTFTFAAAVASGANYAVTVTTQPMVPSQTCTVSNGSGTVTSAGIANVAVTCVTNRYHVGGTVMGLMGTGLVLRDNGGDDLAASANGTFQFATTVASGQGYAVTVAAQPTSPSQTCVVSGGAATVGATDVASVSVSCTTNSYTVGGSVTGLAGAGLVLRDNGGNDLTISGNGSFAFSTAIVSGASYAVTVFAQPTSPWQTCAVTAGSGSVGAGNVTTVAVACTTNAYHVAATVSGLAGTGLVVQNNGAGNLSVTTNGTSTFTATVVSGGAYAVTVLTQPTNPSQTCAVGSGTGVVAGADVTATVTCVTNRYTIGGTLSGLTGGGPVLRNNGGDDLSISANGTFTFATSVASGAAYAVTVGTQPSGQTCTVQSATGTVGSANVTSVVVVCNTLVNGSYETGDYTGWTITSDVTTCNTWGIGTTGQVLSSGGSIKDYETNTNMVQSSPGLPITFSATDGTELAIQMQSCPARHRMYQTVTIPTGTTVLAWDMRYNNTNGSFDATNQYFAVNIRNPTTDAVLATIFKTTQGVDPQQVLTMTAFTAPLTAFVGQTVRIDIEAQVQINWFDLAFDHFRLQ